MRFDQRARSLRRFFWRPETCGGISAAFRKLYDQAGRAEVTVRLFYAFNFFIWLDYLRSYDFSNPDIIIARPLWPLFWIDTAAAPFWMSFFFVANLTAAFFAMLRPQNLTVRLFAFLGLFFFTAVLNSDIAGWERMGSSAQCYVLIALLFLFLPRPGMRRKSKAWRFSFLIVMSQFVLLSSYVASAIWRLRAAFSQAIAGQDSSLGPQAMGKFIEIFSSNGGVSAVDMRVGHLGAFLQANPVVMAPAMLAATLFELAALYVMFRPRFYSFYGALLAVFHLGFILTMNLPFSDHFILILLFLVCSPLNDFYFAKPNQETL